jgi:hypothetical protein
MVTSEHDCLQHTTRHDTTWHGRSVSRHDKLHQQHDDASKHTVDGQRRHCTHQIWLDSSQSVAHTRKSDERDRHSQRQRDRETEHSIQYAPQRHPSTYGPGFNPLGIITRSTISSVGSAPPSPSSMPSHIVVSIPKAAQAGANPSPV